MSDPNQAEPEVDLTPHSMAPRPSADADAEGALMTIMGFVGESPRDGQVRVYRDLSFSSYFEVDAGDVVQTQLVDRDDPDSPRRLWIRPEAQVRVVHVNQITGPASFVQGALRSKYAARLARASDPTTMQDTEGMCTVFWVCDPSSVAITEATGGTWPCSGTDVWPQCPDCC